MKFDNNGNLWFTDEKTNSIWKYFTNEGKFENYRILTEGGYPLSLVFDSNNNVWYTQVFGKSLGFLEPSKVMDNTTEGVSELDISSQIEFQTMGPISNGFKLTDDRNNNSELSDALWFTTDSYPIWGQLVKFNITKQTMTIHDLTYTNSIPISVAEDENGNIWTNDHASSIFIMLNPKTGETKKYATSFPSTDNSVTLPYVNEFRDGKIWFNEHYGNAIAAYDIKNKTLVEYHIPSINPKWGNASNPLRFVFENNGSIWFTEWTENKMGVIPKERINQLPISLDTSKDNLIVDGTNGKGDTVDIFIHKNNLSETISNDTTKRTNDLRKPSNITMFVTFSLSELGELGNITGSFTNHSFEITDVPVSSKGLDQPYKTTLKLNPTNSVEPGNYTLTVSARYNNDITVSKMVDLNVR
jgi:virginiamycin B lyase